MLECNGCSKYQKTEWNCCPYCGSPSKDFTILTAGEREIFPEAFEPQILLSAMNVANEKAFSLALIQYIQQIIASPANLFDLRSRIVEVYIHCSANPSFLYTRSLWVSLVLASDSYFLTKAIMYRWSSPQLEPLRQKWYQMLAAAFLGLRQDELTEEFIKDWTRDFTELHKCMVRPLMGCHLCQSKCVFQYDVKQFVVQSTDLVEQLTAQLSQSDTATDVFAKVGIEQSNDWFSSNDKDLAYCIATHLISEIDLLSRDASIIISDKIRRLIQERLQ
ncbi:MAG: hypothetical protein K2X77_28040 [Candidatus Obscuribacterales bacterium]|nr:hypothetical protein [Candidatus Obscuribacterales bacterium]